MLGAHASPRATFVSECLVAKAGTRGRVRSQHRRACLVQSGY